MVADAPDLSAEERADLDGETLDSLTHLTGFDSPDLTGKVTDEMLRPVRPLRQRTPEDVAIVYRGNKRGLRHAFAVDLVVPDTTNAEAVREIVDTFALYDPRDVDPATQRPTRVQMHVKGPSYHFVRHETTLVHKDDAPFLLAHPVLDFAPALDIHTAAAPVLQSDHEKLQDRIAALEAALAQQTAPPRPQRRRKESASHGA